MISGPSTLFPSPSTFFTSHGAEHELQILLRVPEGALTAQDRVVIGRRQVGRRRHVLDTDQVVAQPFGIRVRARQLALDLLVGDDAPLGGVHEQDAAGVQPLLDADVGDVADGGRPFA